MDSVPSFEDLIRGIKALKSAFTEQTKTLKEAQKTVKLLEKELATYKKLIGKSVQSDSNIPKTKSGKARWEELKEEWETLNPDQADLPSRISDALKAWGVPFRGYIHGNKVLEQFIKWSQDKEHGVPAKEIFNIITLMSRVDFSKYKEFVPTIRATEHLVDKFTKFKEFFEREKIYYYPKNSSEYKISTTAFKKEYRSTAS